MRTRKYKLYLINLIFIILPGICLAMDLDSLKVDFLQGNYRRVIFEGQAQVDRINIGNTDELNYILGLSHLKEGSALTAQDCFKRILNNQSSKFANEAKMGLADSYLMQGQFQEAENIYKKLIEVDANTNLKAALLYRLSQLELKKGDAHQGNSYYLKLKKDFPMSLELKQNKGLGLAKAAVIDSCQYSVQVGFFESSANANNLKIKLLSKGFPAYLESSGAGFRVKVGKFNSQKEALDLEKNLSQSGFPTKVCP